MCLIHQSVVVALQLNSFYAAKTRLSALCLFHSLTFHFVFIVFVFEFDVFTPLRLYTKVMKEYGEVKKGHFDRGEK